MANRHGSFLPTFPRKSSRQQIPLALPTSVERSRRKGQRSQWSKVENWIAFMSAHLSLIPTHVDSGRQSDF